MITLQETTAKFNNNLLVSHTGRRLSSDYELVLVDKLMNVFILQSILKTLFRLKKTGATGNMIIIES